MRYPYAAAEAAAGRIDGEKLSFDQCLAHLGGPEQFITENGRALARQAAHDYIWKYTAERAGWCTACGANVGDMKRTHGHKVTCPACGKTVEFRHAARKHGHETDQFCLFEWRRSAIDPESIALTAVMVWRDSRGDRPERAPLHFDYEAVYVFRPGRAVSAYRSDWEGCRRLEGRHWHRQDSLALPNSKGWGGGSWPVVVDWAEFNLALEGTRIGRTFDMLNAASNRRDTVELVAIGNCARRPWLEYLAKAGQPALAAELMRMDRVPRDAVPRQRARTPRELLGLTEGQWFEIRRDSLRLSCDRLETLRRLQRIGFKNPKVADAFRIYDVMANWRLAMLERSKRINPYVTPTIGDMLHDAGVPEKLRMKAMRRIVGDLDNCQEWRDYYAAAVRAGEDLKDPRWLLPKDMPAMHDRVTARERALAAEREAAKQAAWAKKFAERLKKLRRRYVFRACGLELRPYESVAEIIAEGRALEICIGSYAESYMKGEDIICCLRRAEEPDEPWRAVQFSRKTGKVLQDRGYRNDWAYAANRQKYIEPGTQKQLRNFWAAWERHQQRTGGKTV